MLPFGQQAQVAVGMYAAGQGFYAADRGAFQNFPGSLLDQFILKILFGGAGAQPQDMAYLSRLQAQAAQLQGRDGFPVPCSINRAPTFTFFNFSTAFSW